MTKWSDNDDEICRSLWRAGYTGQMIADYFGVSRSAALGKLNRLGLLGKMKSADRRKRVDAGMAYAQQRSV